MALGDNERKDVEHKCDWCTYNPLSKNKYPCSVCSINPYHEEIKDRFRLCEWLYEELHDNKPKQSWSCSYTYSTNAIRPGYQPSGKVKFMNIDCDTTVKPPHGGTAQTDR